MKKIGKKKKGGGGGREERGKRKENEGNDLVLNTFILYTFLPIYKYNV